MSTSTPNNNRVKLNDGPITVRGQVGNDPDLRVVGQRGDMRVQFRLAKDNGYTDRETRQWVSTDSAWYTVGQWRRAAENTGESLNRGDRVIVVGDLYQRTYTTNEGEVRTVLEIEADEVALSTRFAVVKATRNPREDRPAAAPAQAAPAAAAPAAEPAPAAVPANEFASSPWG